MRWNGWDWRDMQQVSLCFFFSKWLSKWHHRWNDGQQMCYRGSCSIHIRNVSASQIQRLRIPKNAVMLIALCQTDKWGETHLRARIDQMLSCAFRNLGVHALFDYAIRDGLRVGPSPKRRVINTCDNNTAVSICKLVARRGRWPLQKKKERNKKEVELSQRCSSCLAGMRFFCWIRKTCNHNNW